MNKYHQPLRAVEGQSIRQLITALPPGEACAMLDPENQQPICQVLLSSSGQTYYLAGPQFNGDEVINVWNLVRSNMLDEYNELHEDDEQAQIYLADSLASAIEKLQYLFELHNADVRAQNPKSKFDE